jgi:aspartate beta-hydroxylase
LCTNVAGLVYFSIMKPGTIVKPHCGPVNTRLRYHLTLRHDPAAEIRVGDGKRSWQAGECLVFDDSFEHEVWHRGASPRVVLLVDCWHPSLTAQEREIIERLYLRLAGRKPDNRRPLRPAAETAAEPAA